MDFEDFIQRTREEQQRVIAEIVDLPWTRKSALGAWLVVGIVFTEMLGIGWGMVSLWAAVMR